MRLLIEIRQRGANRPSRVPVTRPRDVAAWAGL